MNATVVARVDLTGSIAIFTVRPDDGPRPFTPGQYFSLGLEVDRSFIQRPYSAASLPGSMELAFLVHRVEGGALTPALWSLGRGSRIFLGPPKGLFRLRPDDPRDHMFVATGTGLAPLVAMVDSVGIWAPRKAVVLHGVAHTTELAFRTRLEAWGPGTGVRYAPTISRPAEAQDAHWGGRTGRVTAQLAEVIGDERLDPRNLVAYLCGGPAMIDDATRLLVSLGSPPEAIISERYWTPRA